VRKEHHSGKENRISLAASTKQDTLGGFAEVKRVEAESKQSAVSNHAASSALSRFAL